MAAKKKTTPNEKRRAPRGSVGVKILLSLPEELRDAARDAASREKLNVSEWWRRAAVEHVARSGGAVPGLRWKDEDEDEDK